VAHHHAGPPSHVGLLGMPDPHPGVVFHEIATVHLLLAMPAAGPANAPSDQKGSANSMALKRRPHAWLPIPSPRSRLRARPEGSVPALSTALIPPFDACALGHQRPRDVEIRGAVESARPTPDQPQSTPVHATPGEVAPLDGSQPVSPSEGFNDNCLGSE